LGLLKKHSRRAFFVKSTPYLLSPKPCTLTPYLFFFSNSTEFTPTPIYPASAPVQNRRQKAMSNIPKQIRTMKKLVGGVFSAKKNHPPTCRGVVLTKTGNGAVFRLNNLNFDNSNLFRISIFGFRIYSTICNL
jgi:hypothetical protein